ncbi:MAG: carbohydrate ABC transporter permease [Spirochaetales bacterium]|nr:carbohydrate ABC transporter permease [Spirochaetales bacterium]
MRNTNKALQSAPLLRKIGDGFKSGTIPIHVIFIIYAALCILPLTLVIGISFSSEKSVALNGYRIIPVETSLSAYDFVLKEGGAVLRAYLITILVTVCGTISGLLLVSLYAYPISRRDFKYRRFFSLFAFITMLFTSGFLVPWYIIVVRLLHLKNTFPVLFLPYLQNAWFILIMRTFFKTIPDSLIESAKIDGAGEYRIFFKIIVPLSIPGLATIGLFFALLFWNDFFLNMMFTDNEKMFNLQYLMVRVMLNIQYLSQVTTGSQSAEIMKNIPSRTSQMAMCILSIGPIVFAYPFAQRFFIKGLTVGAIKE